MMTTTPHNFEITNEWFQKKKYTTKLNLATRKEVKHESVITKRIALDLHGVIVDSRMVVLFEYE